MTVSYNFFLPYHSVDLKCESNLEQAGCSLYGDFLNLAVSRRVYDINPSSTVFTVRTATYLNIKVFYFAPHIVLMDLV
jgi:hypothetical protein